MQKERDQLWDRRGPDTVCNSRVGSAFGGSSELSTTGFRSKPWNLLESTSSPAQIATGRGFKVLRVRWPVFEGVHGEGLLLQPDGPPAARIVAIPDADWTPEMLVGLTLGVPPAAQFARRLAESGCQVVVPTLIDRSDTWSGIPGIRMTNQPHREFLYRMAFEVGRHIIGYEVQKVLAVIDWFEQENDARQVLTGVMGYGEGGLLALYAAALDSRIDRTVVSGYFQSRQEALEGADLPGCLGSPEGARRCRVDGVDRAQPVDRGSQRCAGNQWPSCRNEGPQRGNTERKTGDPAARFGENRV